MILIFNLGFAACQADIVSAAATAQRFFRHLAKLKMQCELFNSGETLQREREIE